MKSRITILILLTVLTNDLVGQRLINAKYSSCDEGNFHKYRMNSMINKVKSQRDTTTIDLTWIDNCSFEPEFHLKKLANDTLYFEYTNKSDGETTCTCAFRLQFELQKLSQRDFEIKINNWHIDKKAKRYNTDGYIVEYYPERTSNPKVYREIYTDHGKLIAEVFYDKDGNIALEKYYNESWGFLERERKN